MLLKMEEKKLTGSALRDAEFHLDTCPKLFSSPSQIPVRQPLEHFKSSGFQRKDKSVFGGLLHGDRDGCSCCGANTDSLSKESPEFLTVGEELPSTPVLIG